MGSLKRTLASDIHAFLRTGLKLDQLIVILFKDFSESLPNGGE